MKYNHMIKTVQLLDMVLSSCPSTESLTETDTNMAGYTANTSRGRVSRGGNASYRTFYLYHYQRTDGRTKPLIESLVRD